MKSLYTYSVLALLAASLLFACEKKKSDGVGPGFGSTGNPNPGDVTVTGSTTYSNPATQNTSIKIGGSGWTNPTCGSTSSLTLKGYNGDIEVTLTFAAAAKTGTYTVDLTPGANRCALTISNAPAQPGGIIWYGRSGIVSVNQTTASINAGFTNVVCTQQTFQFPVVTVDGQSVLGCSQ
jgi:hypothetical protein